MYMPTQAAQLDLGFYPIWHFTNYFKNIPKLCLCLCKPGRCFCAQRLRGPAMGGVSVRGGLGSAAVTNDPAAQWHRAPKVALQVHCGLAGALLVVGTQGEGAATNSIVVIVPCGSGGFHSSSNVLWPKGVHIIA